MNIDSDAIETSRTVLCSRIRSAIVDFEEETGVLTVYDLDALRLSKKLGAHAHDDGLTIITDIRMKQPC